MFSPMNSVIEGKKFGFENINTHLFNLWGEKIGLVVQCTYIYRDIGENS